MDEIAYKLKDRLKFIDVKNAENGLEASLLDDQRIESKQMLVKQTKAHTTRTLRVHILVHSQHTNTREHKAKDDIEIQANTNDFHKIIYGKQKKCKCLSHR